MYSKTKYLTEDEFQKLKEKDAKRLEQSYIYNFPYITKSNYYANSRKKIQRVLNFYVRECNRIIKNDYLWRERFFVRQIGYPHYYRFEDGSGGELFVTLRFYDKKTMKYIDSFGCASNFCFGWGSVFWLMNKAITEIFDVWKRDKNYPDAPEKDRIDYTSIPNDWVAENAEPLCPNYNYFYNK